jgi:hypothetical protein
MISGSSGLNFEALYRAETRIGVNAILTHVPPVLPFLAPVSFSLCANFMALILSSSTIRLYDLISKLFLAARLLILFFLFFAQTGFC